MVISPLASSFSLTKMFIKGQMSNKGSKAVCVGGECACTCVHKLYHMTVYVNVRVYIHERLY